MEQAEQARQGDEDSSRASETRKGILSAAKELVAQKGPGGTTVRDITNASGTNGAAVNYHFQSKSGLVRLATEEITGDVNRERLARLDALEGAANGKPLSPHAILNALISPILDVSRSKDGGSLYVRTVFQMRVDLQAAYGSFGLNGHVARRFIDAIMRTFPALTRDEAIWHYELARGSAIHLLANLDPFSRRFELLAVETGEALAATPVYELNEAQVARVIALILGGFGNAHSRCPVLTAADS